MINNDIFRKCCFYYANCIFLVVPCASTNIDYLCTESFQSSPRHFRRIGTTSHSTSEVYILRTTYVYILFNRADLQEPPLQLAIIKVFCPLRRHTHAHRSKCLSFPLKPPSAPRAESRSMPPRSALPEATNSTRPASSAVSILGPSSGNCSTWSFEADSYSLNFLNFQACATRPWTRPTARSTRRSFSAKTAMVANTVPRDTVSVVVPAACPQTLAPT